ncbi:MAG TPA: anthranilate phosphoribosyltransferase [Chitinispirillaceae bacterium]|nr:anthranilate phosphoribosyltransferase [Chitinispirillaceae bacterium]
MTIQEAIKRVITGASLSREEMIAVFTNVMSGGTTDAQIASFITALRMKGETSDEITGAAMVMRQMATKVIPSSDTHTVDTCGTGGDGSNTFNISTASAFVSAGAGAVVAKHGNRSVSSKCGSADVLEMLGVTIDLNAEQMKNCIDSVGICFLFAPLLHKAMKYAIGPRREIAVRTIFNVLGPLTNPANARSQVLGVFAPELTDVIASVLGNLGVLRAYVVYGMDGLDEISISAETKVSEINNGVVRTYMITPEEFNLQRGEKKEIAGGTPAENASIVREILNGKKGINRDVVVLNAAFALAASGVARDPQEGIKLACQSIDSGKAVNVLERLVSFTSQYKKETAAV